MAEKKTESQAAKKTTLPPGEQYKRDLAKRRAGLRKAYGQKTK